MTANDICRKAKEIANRKTAYIKTCPGVLLTQQVKLRYCGVDPFNSRNSKKIFALPEDTIGYDEFTFFEDATGIKANNLKNIIAVCCEVSKDFSTIKPGEIVFGGDRFGIFVGGHDVVAVNSLGVGMTIIEGWASHGKLIGVVYDEPVEEVKESEDAEREVEGDVSGEVSVEESASEPEPEKAPEVGVYSRPARRRH